MNIQETITNKIVAAIENGAGEFVMPWHRSGVSAALPHNPISKNTYSGANVISLWIEQKERSYSSNQWATYKHWQSVGATVRKGEKAVHCAYFSQGLKTKQNEQGEDETRSFMFAKPFFLFNADQVEGYSASGTPDTLPENLVQRIENADQAIKATGAEIIEGGQRAFYRPSTDAIYMPDQWRFRDGDGNNATQAYYSTLLHELTHWSGAETRLNRTKGKRFGDDAYAFEELVAELGAAFLCASLGIENEPRIDHAQYIEGWLRVLNSNKNAIFSAASLATKAMQYILKAEAQPEAIAA